eukprot:PhM_4_TR16716/c0_g1_i1/m.16322
MEIEDIIPPTKLSSGSTVYLQSHHSDVVERKIRDLPTIDGLLAEEPPHEYSDSDIELYSRVVQRLIEMDPQEGDNFEMHIKALRKAFRVDCNKSLMIAAYQDMVSAGVLEPHHYLESHLIKKGTRSHSGVLVVTVFTSPTPTVRGQKQTFSCKWNCYYCPNEPGQPRSYLLNEPGVRRANMNHFDAVLQFRARVEGLAQIGHPPDKVEILVLGGTWESYPEEYRIDFIRDIFYAANTFRQPQRLRLSLADEQKINETAKTRIIGVTIETRPDTINEEMLVKLRQLGCTRVQLGVQHTDDAILTAVNRESTREDFVRALRLLKDACFKVDIHIMPDLPGSTPEGDKRMFDELLSSPELQADQWKIYPCQTVPWTVIQRWFEEGRYKPYGFENLVDVITYAKKRVHPWIRLNRVIRDIPSEYVLGGNCCLNLRQLLEIRMKAEGTRCHCMRCREIKGDRIAIANLNSAELVVREYDGSGGREYFISFENPERTNLYAFLRLRISAEAGGGVFPELQNCALIRELHVYGRLVRSNVKSRVSTEAQHTGFGKKLLEKAEDIARSSGCAGVAVISGVGVRSYYSRRGYVLVDRQRGAFQIKTLKRGFVGNVVSSPVVPIVVRGVVVALLLWCMLQILLSLFAQ